MSEKTKVIIIGGKGTAVNIAEQLYDAIERYGLKAEFMGFAFDDESLGDSINNFPVLCKTYDVKEKYGKYDDVKFIYQLYRPDKLRERTDLLNSFEIPLEKFYTFIHPTTYMARSAKVGYGTVLYSNCVINSNAVIGHHNTFNSGCLIGHDTKIGNNNFFAAQALIGSNTVIKNYVFVGLNATVNNMITLEDNIMVGMGSCVVKSVEGDQIIVGNPARKIKDMV